MRATGIPPHITIMLTVEELKQRNAQMQQIMEEGFEKIVPDIVAGVEKVIDDRAVGAGTVTMHGLKDMLDATLRNWSTGAIFFLKR